MKSQLIFTETDWEDLLNSINDSVFILDSNYNIEWYNSKAGSVYELDKTNFTGRGFADLVDPELHPDIEIYIALTLQSEKSPINARHIKASGEPFPVIVNTKLMKAGDEFYFVHTTKDITKSVMAEEQLKKSEKKYEELVEIAPIGIFVLVDGKIEYANRIAMFIFGTDSEENVIGKSIFDFIHPDYYRLFMHRINSLREGMTSPIIEIETLGLNSRSMNIEVTAKPIDYLGKKGVEVFMHDITIRKKADERINLLASIVESSEDAIIAKDLEGTILYWNVGAEKLYGYKSNEVVGKSINILTPDGKRDELPELFNIIKKGGSINQYKTFRKRKDGGVVKVSIKISPIKFKDVIIGASAIYRAEENA